MSLTLKGNKPKPAPPVKIDFRKGAIELSVKELNQQLKKFGYKIIKIKK